MTIPPPTLSLVLLTRPYRLPVLVDVPFAATDAHPPDTYPLPSVLNVEPPHSYVFDPSSKVRHIGTVEALWSLTPLLHQYTVLVDPLKRYTSWYPGKHVTDRLRRRT